MSANPEEEIAKKLQALETQLQEDSQQHLTLKEKRSEVSTSEQSKDEKSTVKADFHLLGGFTLLALGLFMVLHHVRVTTGMVHFFGFGGSGGGFIVIPLLVGIGIMFYDFKNKVGWLLAGGGMALLLFVVLSQLILYFPSMSLMGFILMFLPLAAGAGFVAKGMRMHKQLEEKPPKATD